MVSNGPDDDSESDGPESAPGDGAGGEGDDIPAPTIAEDRLPDDWDRVSDTVEMLFDIPGTGVSVRGRTVVYEDTPLREAVHDATDGRVDQVARFCFATRLQFRPPLPPGIGTQMVLPMVRNQAHNRFVTDLVDRGFESIEQERSERAGSTSGAEVRLQKITGHYPLDAVDRDLPIEGWVGVWNADDIFVAGGAYPAVSLATIFDGDDELHERGSSSYRDDLLGLIRRVE